MQGVVPDKIEVLEEHWLDKQKEASCIVRQRLDWIRWKPVACCAWCQDVTGQCDCSNIFATSLPWIGMSHKNNVLFYKDSPFFHQAGKKNELTPQVALYYAHMRIEKQQQEIDVLKQELQQMKRTMSDFIAACELVPDGPMAQEIVERTQKMLKK